MRFDRIYVGAGARSDDAARLGALLKPGGILVGPFEEDRGAGRRPFGVPQALLKATRSVGDGRRAVAFASVRELLPARARRPRGGARVSRGRRTKIPPQVQFAPLARGADGPSRPFALRGPAWARDPSSIIKFGPPLFAIEQEPLHARLL